MRDNFQTERRTFLHMSVISDSGVSISSSSGPSSAAENKMEVQDPPVVDQEEADESEDSSSLRLGSSFLSKSVCNLSLNDSDLSRSGSSCSLANSPAITPAEIRSLTNNYHKMMKQATREIKKLKVDRWKLEQDQDRLLNTNLELTEEVRKLITDQKQWKSERQVRIQHYFLIVFKKVSKLSNGCIEVTQGGMLVLQIEILEIFY